MKKPTAKELNFLKAAARKGGLAPTQKEIHQFYSAAQWRDNARIQKFLDTFGNRHVDAIAPGFFMGEGMTALMIAAQCNHETTVKLLLSRGADVTLKSERGLSPLGYSIFYGRDRDPAEDYIPDILIAAGAPWQDDIAAMKEHLTNLVRSKKSPISLENYTALSKETDERCAEIQAIVKNPERLKDYNHARDTAMTAAVEQGIRYSVRVVPRINCVKRKSP